MLTRRVLSLCLVLGILGIWVMLVLNITGGGVGRPSGLGGLGRWADQAVAHQLRGQTQLAQLAPALMLQIGITEQDGIFITKEYLLENIKPKNPQMLEDNLKGIEAFLDKTSLSTAVLVIPTACAIKQQEIPPTAQLYNQKALIADTYARVAGRTTTVDVYTALFSAKEQYTYYRTEPNLTGLGGYYVYTALARRLGLTPRSLDQFQILHAAEDFYGELYDRSAYKGVRPDIVTVYDFYKFDRQYRVLHTDETEQRAYYTLFPQQQTQLTNPLDLVLGGFSPRMDVAVASPYEQSMLILADETVLSYLPFLLVHYGNATVLDLTKLTEQELAAVDMDSYDTALFAFSADSLLNRPVSAAAGLLVG